MSSIECQVCTASMTLIDRTDGFAIYFCEECGAKRTVSDE